MENPNKLERSELWEQIYAIVKQIPRKETNEDAVDALSATTSIEKLISSYKIKAENIVNKLTITDVNQQILHIINLINSFTSEKEIKHQINEKLKERREDDFYTNEASFDIGYRLGIKWITKQLEEHLEK